MDRESRTASGPSRRHRRLSRFLRLGTTAMRRDRETVSFLAPPFMAGSLMSSRTRGFQFQTWREPGGSWTANTTAVRGTVGVRGRSRGLPRRSVQGRVPAGSHHAKIRFCFLLAASRRRRAFALCRFPADGLFEKKLLLCGRPSGRQPFRTCRLEIRRRGNFRKGSLSTNADSRHEKATLPGGCKKTGADGKARTGAESKKKPPLPGQKGAVD